MTSQKRTKELLQGLYNSKAISIEDLKKIQTLINNKEPFYIKEGKVFVNSGEVIANVTCVNQPYILTQTDKARKHFIEGFSNLVVEHFSDIASLQYDNQVVELCIIVYTDESKQYLNIEESDKRRIALDIMQAINDADNCMALLDYDMAMLLHEVIIWTRLLYGV